MSQGNNKRETEDPPIQADGGAVLADTGQAGGADGEECTHAYEAEDEAQDAAGDGEHHALGEELADDAAALRAEGGADGEFALAAGGADEQQVGDVGAGDEQDQADGAEQHEERAAGVTDDGIAQGLNAEVALRICPGEFAQELLPGELHLGIGLVQRDAGFQHGGDLEEVALVGGVWIELEGHPQIGLRSATKSRPVTPTMV